MDSLVAGEVALVAEGGLAAVTLVGFVTVGLPRVPLEEASSEKARSLIAERRPHSLLEGEGNTRVSTSRRWGSTASSLEPPQGQTQPPVPRLPIVHGSPERACEIPSFLVFRSQSWNRGRRQIQILR